jgi:hypothetical protein
LQQSAPSQEDGDFFPLPPTAEELAEMENMYARVTPPAVNPKPKMAGNQANLMQELKRRVSHDDTSDV